MSQLSIGQWLSPQERATGLPVKEMVTLSVRKLFFFYDVATGELYHQEIRTHPKLSWKGVALGLYP